MTLTSFKYNQYAEIVLLEIFLLEKFNIGEIANNIKTLNTYYPGLVHVNPITFASNTHAYLGMSIYLYIDVSIYLCVCMLCI